jgi:beta-lactamase superfamily II metal-dependent hydrolase
LEFENSMLLDIYDVEHGACALVTTSNGRRILIDCGHNATTGWRPGTFLRSAGITAIDRLCVTNYDEDHVSGLPDLLGNVAVGALFRNPSVLPATIRQLKSEDGMGRGIETLVNSAERIFTGGAAPEFDFGDTSFSFYHNHYGAPPFGFDDENNLSLVVFVRCGQHKIIFPGDMEKAGWRQLLLNPAFRQELRDVNLFVASHHGRENGYCKEVMDLCPRIEAVVISDKKKGYQSQNVDEYQRHAIGVTMDKGDTRRVLTTRRDASMMFEFQPLDRFRFWIGFRTMPAAA